MSREAKEIANKLSEGAALFAREIGNDADAAAREVREFFVEQENLIERLAEDAVLGDPLADEGLKLLTDAAASRSGFGNVFIGESRERFNAFLVGLVRGLFGAAAVLA